MRITNIDTLSVLFDRLISENIKQFFFKKSNDFEKVDHQQIVIDEIKLKITNLLEECISSGKYEYIAEKRTFNSSDIVEELEQLITHDIIVGESDRGVLNQIISDTPDVDNLKVHGKRMRKANEGRSLNKNNIDLQFKNLIEGNE
jgi:hypothetical protein